MRTVNTKRRAMAGNHRGFSLIELMVVVVIVAILAAIEYPSYQASVRKARRAEGRAALMGLMQQQERYYSQNASYLAFSAAAANGFKWYSSDRAATSAYEIGATACSNDTIQNCVLLTAMPGTQNVDAHFTDALCGNLTLTSAGEKSATGSAVQCW